LKLPDVNMPFTDKMPKPQEFIANAYDFAEQLMASQRKFAEDVVKASAPLLWGVSLPDCAGRPRRDLWALAVTALAATCVLNCG
jgi:hypothetical protein